MTENWWTKQQDNAAEAAVIRVGVRESAVKTLGDVVFVSLPARGATLQAGQPVCDVESATETLTYVSEFAGTIHEVNDVVETDPEAVNRDPHGAGWLFEIMLEVAP